MTTTTGAPERIRTILFNRVPEVTVVFWVIKILSTTSGETAADYLKMTFGFGLSLTTLATGLLLVAALAVQLSTARYAPAAYWIVVVLAGIFGTLLTDNLTGVFGLPPWASTLIFTALLGLTFGAWFYRERTLSIHTIFTRRREVFYWVAILFTFALGTAAADLITEGFGLGYLFGTILFASLIGIIAIARFTFTLNGVVCFWVAYVLTWPLGASLGDLLSQSTDDGGLGLGTTETSLAFLLVVVAGVVYSTAKVARERAAASLQMNTPQQQLVSEP